MTPAALVLDAVPPAPRSSEAFGDTILSSAEDSARDRPGSLDAAERDVRFAAEARRVGSRNLRARRESRRVLFAVHRRRHRV